jgi:hypothetical protein
MAKLNRTTRRELLGQASLAGLGILGVSLVPTPAAAQGKYAAIRKGIEALREAREELEQGRKIFGGHRVKAIRAIDEALKELRAALEYAEKNS